MPRNRIRTYRSNRNGKSFKPYTHYSEEKLQTAIQAVKDNILSIGDAATTYDVPKTTLWRKLKKINCTQEKAGRPTLFSITEERCFIEHIKTLSEWGFPFDMADLRILAQKYLEKIGKVVYGLKDNTPGTDWARNFLSRYKDELSNRLATNICTQRAKITPRVIDDFFENYNKTVKGVSPDCIINYDETNLTDDPGNKKYIYKRGTKYPERVINSSKTAVSLMFSGTADGHLLPIYVVYKAEHLWDTWLEGGPENTRYNRSKSGWFDGVCFEDWFYTVIVPYAKSKPGRKVIIGDNLSSHFSERVLKTCEELSIAFVCLPPKTTHLLQPLDVAFYAPLKNYWRSILTQWKKLEGRKHKTLVKSSFPRLLNKLKNKLIEKDADSNNLIAGFNKTGLYPINPDRPKSRLPQRDELCSEQEVYEKTSQVVTEMLQEMRGVIVPDETPKRKKKCNVAPGKSVTLEDIAIITTNEKNTLKKGKNKKQVTKALVDYPLTSSEESEIDSDLTFVASDDYNLPGTSGTKNSVVKKIPRKITNKKIFKKHKVEVDKKNESVKGKGIGKKSKPGKENNSGATNTHSLNLDTTNQCKNSKKKKTMSRESSSDTSVSSIMSLHSDSDIADISDNADKVNDSGDEYSKGKCSTYLDINKFNIYEDDTISEDSDKYETVDQSCDSHMEFNETDGKGIDRSEERTELEKTSAINNYAEENYDINQDVLVRYYRRKKWTYYIGYIEKVKPGTEACYEVRFYKTCKKPLRFISTKRPERDDVPTLSIVKKIQLTQDSDNLKGFVLSNQDDAIYFS